MPSGAVYQTGSFTWVERWAIFNNARLDLVEYLNAQGQDAQRIAAVVSMSARAVGDLVGFIERRAKAEAGEKPAPATVAK